MSWQKKLKKLESEGRVKRSKSIGRPKLEIEYIKITLKGIQYDWNKVLELMGRSPFKHAAWKKAQEALISSQLLQTPKITYRAKYVYNWFEPNRRKDPGNIAGSEKLIADALQKCGIIENDGWDQISGIEHRFSIDKANPRLELEIIGI